MLTGYHGLVRSLAAMEGLKNAAGDGLARRGDPLRRADQIKVDASHYNDWSTHLDS
jgi:hypothetical protein